MLEATATACASTPVLGVIIGSLLAFIALLFFLTKIAPDLLLAFIAKVAKPDDFKELIGYYFLDNNRRD